MINVSRNLLVLHWKSLNNRGNFNLILQPFVLTLLPYNLRITMKMNFLKVTYNSSKPFNFYNDPVLGQ